MSSSHARLAHGADDFDILPADPIRRVELAMEDLRAGRPIILVDDEDRENEGDIVYAAERTTPEAINFMAKHARGLICLSLTGAQVERLGLPMMSAHNQSAYSTAFTVSIEAREGVSTGISAADRAHTVQVAIRPDATRRDLVTPGHIFPLRARDGGVLERVGQTEGSVDLCRLAGLNPAAVICEIMNDDGTMARMPELQAFARQHRVRIAAVADIIKYRMQQERIVRPVSEGEIEIPGHGRWRTRLYRTTTTDGLHMAVWKGAFPDDEPALVRVQAAPPAWSLLMPHGDALSAPALKAIAKIDQEGRGALVLMHLRGVSHEFLERTFERDVHGEAEPTPVPRADALRDLGAGCQILRDLGLHRVRLLMNTGRPVLGIEAYGLEVVERVPIG
jgi:3,4-dihydroxy 2-butanone 4-phosphate synthase/GTP cyclohydrolase II